MKIYKTQEEVNADIHNGVLAIVGDVKFEFDVVVNGNINARNIDAGNINAWDIDAGDIDARDIVARNINAWNINARDINYYAVCYAYNNITCKSIASRKINSKHFCLDGEIKIEQKEVEELTMEEVCKLLGKEIKIKK